MQSRSSASILRRGIPQCAIGTSFNNGFGGKMPGVAFLGTNAAYGGRGFAADSVYMPWGHTNPTYSLRDDIAKSVGRHTLQFGAQYVFSQRNQTNNAIGAASGDLQGLLTFSNLAHSTGNAFADFLLQAVFNGVTTRLHSKFHPGLRATPLLPALPDRGAVFSGRLEGYQPPHGESGAASQPVRHLPREKQNAWNWEAARFNADAVCSGSGVTAFFWTKREFGAGAV